MEVDFCQNLDRSYSGFFFRNPVPIRNFAFRERSSRESTENERRILPRRIERSRFGKGLPRLDRVFSFREIAVTGCTFGTVVT